MENVLKLSATDMTLEEHLTPDELVLVKKEWGEHYTSRPSYYPQDSVSHDSCIIGLLYKQKNGYGGTDFSKPNPNLPEDLIWTLTKFNRYTAFYPGDPVMTLIPLVKRIDLYNELQCAVELNLSCIEEYGYVSEDHSTDLAGVIETILTAVNDELTKDWE